MFWQVISLQAILYIASAFGISIHSTESPSSLNAPAKTSKVCYASRLCFESFNWQDESITIGLALPPAFSPSFADEFIMNITAPLNYGFAGMGPPDFNISSGTSRLSVLVAIEFSAIIEPPTVVPISKALVQMSRPLSNNTLTPANGNATISLFSQSHIGPETMSYTFRCQHCGVLPESDTKQISLEAFTSESVVQYINDEDTRANAPLGGVETTSFSLDLHSARFNEETYASFLRVGGVSI